MNNNIDFLTVVNYKRLRKEINNICNSYSHPWDILAELLQNSIDAINKFNKIYPDLHRSHKIEIEIDCQKRSLRIYDSGIGLELEKLADCLAPHGTDKDDDVDSIGEKGVGLTFTIFSALEAVISSVNAEGSYKAEIKSLSSWKNNITDLNDIPRVVIPQNTSGHVEPNNYYTEIILNRIEKIYDDRIDIFHISINRLIYILQTRTSIGYLNSLWGKPHPQIEIILKHTNLDNYYVEMPVEFKYRLPSSFLNPNDIINYDSFIQQAASMSDMQKSSKLKGKSLELIGSVQKAGRTIKYYAFYVSSRTLWKNIANQNNLIIPNNTEDADLEIRGGIFLSTKGMPTGVEIVPPITGASGYWANLYILIEDNALNFDLGRKSIPGPTQNVYKTIAKDIFTKLTAFTEYISKDPPTSQQISTLQQAQKTKAFSDLERLNDLSLDTINYLKYPDGQEASVVAIFHELIGSKNLIGYYSLKHGYKLTYDFWGKYIINLT